MFAWIAGVLLVYCTLLSYLCAVLHQNGFRGFDINYYWLGMDRIHALTGGGDFKLRVELQENGTELWYSVESLYFQVGNDTEL